jgi:hypothetical protein
MHFLFFLPRGKIEKLVVGGGVVFHVFISLAVEGWNELSRKQEQQGRKTKTSRWKREKQSKGDNKPERNESERQKNTNDSGCVKEKREE